ncbi:MAG: sodium:calcium antiporter [Candidatus Bathyarchaeota archaeon]|nr:sodium:calcium antiporter [Candidatus Bathyarchaeota archaeon]
MAEATFSQLLVNVVIIAVAFVILNWASNLTINNAVKVSNITKLGKTAVGFSLLAFTTSLPELTVALIAAFSGGVALSIGNILGSNIANICVVVGIAAFIVFYHSRRVKGKHIDRNIIPSFAQSELSSIHFGLFISSIIPILLIYLATSSWIVGLILICIFVGYMYQLSKVRIPTDEEEPVTSEEKSKLSRFLIFTIAGALGVVGSAYFLVESAVVIAEAAGLSQQVIGATVIAIGTSLPELVLSVKSILRGHSGLAFGGIIGSSFVNITLILGVSIFVPALLGTSIVLQTGVFQNIVLFSIMTNMFFWYFLSRGYIGHKEGAVFLFIYILFIITTIGAL